MNTHAIPDTFFENQAVWGDLGPAVIVAHTGLTVPASSLTMPAVAANGYVLATGPPARLVYVSQPAVSVTLSGGNGTYWLALHTDLSTAVSGWTRRAGSHYLWQMNAVSPGNPPDGITLAQITVAGGVITAVMPIALATAMPMSKQSSANVAITGGTARGLTDFDVDGTTLVVDHVNHRVGIGTAAPAELLAVAGLLGVLTAYCYQRASIGRPVINDVRLALDYPKSTDIGLVITQTGADTGREAVVFRNVATAIVGSIQTSATATSFNTTSDARLKRHIAPLTGALDRVRALRPVSHLWNVDDSPGESFLAHELMGPCPLAVTGLPNEVNDDGSIRPQQVDHSRLMPLAIAGMKELLAMVESLTARVASLEGALGL